MISPVDMFDQRVLAQTSGALGGYVTTVLHTNLAAWILAALLFYAAAGGGIVLFMEQVYPEKRDDPQFLGMLDPLGGIQSFVYFMWLRLVLSSFTSGLVEYRRHLQDLRWMAMVLAHRTTDAAAALDALKRLVYLSDAVLRPGPSVLTEVQIMVPSEDPASEFPFTVHALLQTVDAPATAALLADTTNRVVSTISTSEAGALIHEPIVFKAHLQGFLLFWFGIWVTITIWARVGWLYTVVTYPFIMFILTSPGVYRMWLGSPWSALRPLRLAEHERWPGDIIDDMERLFDDDIKRPFDADKTT